MRKKKETRKNIYFLWDLEDVKSGQNSKVRQLFFIDPDNFPPPPNIHSNNNIL